ncbi:MAG: glucose-6-phosphate isomerase [Myxococcota bacterium]
MTWKYLELEEPGVALDLRWMGLPDDWPKTLADRMERAFVEMRDLEAGAIANPDEERRVGHYWLRAPERAPEGALRTTIPETRREIEAFVDGLDDRFRDVLHVGIGGSALGPQLVSDALGRRDDPRRLHWFDNTDPDGVARTLAGIDPERTLVLVVSKSGRTPETRNGMLAAQAAFEEAGVPFALQAVAITGAGSDLDREAERDGWLARFPMWDWVGGRTSITAAVGLVPMMLQGLDADGFLGGARAMDEVTRVEATDANPAALLAAAWFHATGGEARRAMVVLPYRDRLVLLSRYLQQLVMESLGKRLDREGRVVHQGLTVYGNKGSTDQHAYVQQLRDGPDDFFASFVEVLEDGPSDLQVDDGATAGDYLSGFLHGTRKALHEAGRASLTLTIPRVDARRLGALVALHERAVGLYASLVDVNAYHQPGVEAGKKAAAGLLDLQRRLLARLGDGASGTAEELGADLDADPADAFHVLRHLAANGRVRAEGMGLRRRFSAS